MELNDKEKTIVDLINRLAEVADDETTTQDAIDKIVNNIRTNTSESIQEEMDNVDREIATPSPQTGISDELRNAISEQTIKVITELGSCPPVPTQNGHSCGCGGHHGEVDRLVFTRIREVKKPGKAHPTDAGIDFYVPDEKSWNDDFKQMVISYSKNPDDTMVHFEKDESNGGQVIIVEPEAHVAIPSGIKTIIPEGLGMMFVNKSGVATKKKLDHSACLVDSAYRDEVIMCFFNHSTTPITIEPGMKITQGLIVPIINLDIQEVLNCVYDDMGKDTDRGGGFGSSGSK